MKVDVIFLLLGFFISALIGYGFYWINVGDFNNIIIAIISGIMVFINLAGLLAIKGKSRGKITNIKVISGLFLVITLITNGVFSVFNFVNPAAYIIVNGLEFFIYILICYSIIKALK